MIPSSIIDIQAHSADVIVQGGMLEKRKDKELEASSYDIFPLYLKRLKL